MGSILKSILRRLQLNIFLVVNVVYLCIPIYRFRSDVDTFDLLWKVLMDNLIYLGFADGASRHAQNLASAAWVIYYPSDQLLVSRGICIIRASKNVVEYIVVINLLSEAISLGVDSLVVYLDSQLVVSQINNIYCVRDPYLYCNFMRVCLLQRSFIYITFIHIPRSKNSFADSIANRALDLHINHSSH